MELFELTKIMFEDPVAYKQVTPGEKRKHFFMINRRMSIQFPLQADILQHIKISEEAVIDFWQKFLRQQYNKTPYWMFIKGTKKQKENKEKKIDIKESSLKSYAIINGFDFKSIKETLEIYPEELKNEIKSFEKYAL